MKKKEVVHALKEGVALEKTANEICVEHLRILSGDTEIPEKMIERVRATLLDLILRNDIHIVSCEKLLVNILEEGKDDY